jgi:hypothetical protein
MSLEIKNINYILKKKDIKVIGLLDHFSFYTCRTCVARWLVEKLKLKLCCPRTKMTNLPIFNQQSMKTDNNLHHTALKPTLLKMDNKEGEEESDSGPGTDWAELTQECLTNVLSRLTLEHRWRGAMLVCKSWLQACKDASLHSAFDLEPHFGLAIDSARWWTPEFERKIDSMLQSIVVWSDGSLSEIRTRHCSDRSLLFVAARYTNNHTHTHTKKRCVEFFCFGLL